MVVTLQARMSWLKQVDRLNAFIGSWIMYFFAATLIFTVLYLTVSAFAEMDEDEDGEITQDEFIKVKASATQMNE